MDVQTDALAAGAAALGKVIAGFQYSWKENFSHTESAQARRNVPGHPTSLASRAIGPIQENANTRWTEVEFAGLESTSPAVLKPARSVSGRSRKSGQNSDYPGQSGDWG